MESVDTMQKNLRKITIVTNVAVSLDSSNQLFLELKPPLPSERVQTESAFRITLDPHPI
jgi:hypothetical protein